MPLRNALLGACLALPLAGFAGLAQAQSPQPERVIRVPAGAVVLVLPGAAPQAMAQEAPMPQFAPPPPMLRLMAQQDAMMQQMLRQVRTMDAWSMALPDPEQIIRAAAQGMPTMHVAPGTSVVTTMVSDGHGVCRQTVTYRMTPDGAQPQVHVTRTGDHCDALLPHGPVGVTQTVPAAPSQRPNTMPAAAPRHHPQLWTVGDPPQPIPAGVPRT